MTVSIRIVKGRDSTISLPGANITSAELVGENLRLPIDGRGEVLIITAASIASVPVPQVADGVFPCYISIDGDQRIPCEVLVNPERPLL